MKVLCPAICIEEQFSTIQSKLDKAATPREMKFAAYEPHEKPHTIVSPGSNSLASEK